jgi:hypothetical protein
MKPRSAGHFHVRTQGIRPVGASLKIFSAWFFGSAAVGSSLIWFLHPMAGLFFLIVVATALSMTVAPIAHIVLRRKGVPFGESISTLVIGALALFFILAFTGWFNFT